MIERIVSGGQTGVDRGALDAALAAGTPCGGWCPRGRRAEDGVIPARYKLREAPSAGYIERTRRNVRDSDATLVLGWGTPRGGTAATIGFADRLGRPCLVLDMAAIDDRAATSLATAWISHNRIGVLNVAGPRGSGREEAHVRARAVIEAVLRARLIR